jgi:hypothetical protein
MQQAAGGRQHAAGSRRQTAVDALQTAENIKKWHSEGLPTGQLLHGYREGAKYK